MPKTTQLPTFGLSTLKLGGDWAPRQRTVDFQSSPDTLLIANLEGPVLHSHNSPAPRQKAGPAISNTILPDASNCIWALANNHLMDFGDQGRISTEANLNHAGHLYVGAGKNLSSAAAGLIIKLNGFRVGLISRCETQFGIATATQPGVAAFDATIYQAIQKLKKKCDVVIVSIHAAAEMVPWPSPRRQDSWRALIDAGADIVHGHHAHVPQGYEYYENGIIFYGLGNLCIDPMRWVKHPNALWSLTPELSWKEGKPLMTPTITIIEDKGDVVCVRNANPEETSNHQKYIADCNRPLNDRQLLEGLWQEAVLRMYQSYFSRWLGFSRPEIAGARLCLRELVRRASRKLGLKKFNPPATPPNQSQYLLWYHLFACDSHNDAISTALGVLSGELEDIRTSETRHLIDHMMPIIEG